jgi:hypothetical protein
MVLVFRSGGTLLLVSFLLMMTLMGTIPMRMALTKRHSEIHGLPPSAGIPPSLASSQG